MSTTVEPVEEPAAEEQPDEATLIRDGLDAAFAAEGYVTKDRNGNDVRDREALAEAIYAEVENCTASNSDERSANGVIRGNLVAAVFPSAVGPSSPEWANADEIDRKVWKKLDDQVSSLAASAHTGRVQKLVGTRKPGFVLCTTKDGIIRENTTFEGVYITDNIDLILEDFSMPLKDKVSSAAERLAKNIAMVIKRRPDDAKVLRSEVEQGMSTAASLAKSTLKQLTPAKADASDS